MENAARCTCYWCVCTARTTISVSPYFQATQRFVKEKGFCLIFLFIFFLIFPNSSHAQSKGTFTIEPSYSEHVIGERDKEVSSSVQLYNSTDKPLRLKMYALDIKQTNDRGEIAFMDKPMQGNAFTLATFVQVSGEILTIEPGQKAPVGFSIRNSPDLSPGGHYAALIAQLMPDEGQSGQQVLPALSSVLLIRKQGGERFHLSLVNQEREKDFFRFTFPKTFALTFSNEGNVHITPRGIVEFTDIFGRVTHKGIVNEGSQFVLPQVRRFMPTSISSIRYSLPIMYYSVKVQGRSEPGDIKYFQSYSFMHIDPLALSVFMSCSLLAYIGFKRLKRYHKKRRVSVHES